MRKSFDLMKWWPLLMAMITLISSQALLYYRVDALEKRADKGMERMMSLGQGINDLNVKCAKMEGNR